jgi:putative N6-adenine-specific DNA methylase
MKKFDLIATAAMGLEAIVAKEVRSLGYECTVDNGKVLFSGDELAIARSNVAAYCRPNKNKSWRV